MFNAMHNRILTLIGLLALLVLPACAAETTFQPSPHFTGTALPTPPQQAKAWTPPATNVPAEWLSATAALVKRGLSDPRGCEYREVAVGTGNCWSGDSGVTQTHGWLLPAKEGEPRFAICWNGLVYPAVTVGKSVNLAADVQKLVKADDDMRAKQAKEHPNYPFTRLSSQAMPEGWAIAATTMAPLRVCLLLRLGEGALAERLWTAWLAGAPRHTNNNNTAREDPYLMLDTDVTWSLFDRAVCAHIRGDDRLALVDARVLTKIAPQVDKEDANRGFLQPLPALLADSEQRVKSPRTSFSLAAISAEKDKGKRIAALIDALSEVHEMQDGQPGGVTLSQSPIVLALVREGTDAVEPLLADMETDTRLTRSVSFGRDFHRGRNLITVFGAAYTAISDILQTRDFGQRPETDKDGHPLDARAQRRAMVGVLRDYGGKIRA